MEQVHNNQFAQGGIVIALISGFLIYIKSFGIGLYNFIKRKIMFNVTIEANTELYRIFNEYLNKNYNSTYRNVIAEYRYKDSENKTSKIVFTHLIDNFIIWYKYRPIFIRKNREKLEAAQNLHSFFLDSYTISGLFSEKLIRSILLEVKLIKDAECVSKLFTDVYVSSDSGDLNFFKSVKFKSFNSVFLNKGKKQQIIKTLDTWKNNKSWYKERAIPFKIGILLFGPPGTGKSSIGQAIAENYGMRYVYCNLNSFTSDEKFIQFMNLIPMDSVVVFEDIDCIFSDRNAKDKPYKLNFNTLLNCLSGSLVSEGIIFVMTTNHIEKLDPALIRDGRCDLRLEITNPEKDIVEEYLNNFYNKTDIKLSENYITNRSMSTVQTICLANIDNIDKTVEILSK